MKIIAYTYEAAMHCPVCTYKRFAPSCHQSTPLPGFADKNGVPQRAKDREGNPVHPVYDIDERNEHDTHCDTCHADFE